MRCSGGDSWKVKELHEVLEHSQWWRAGWRLEVEGRRLATCFVSSTIIHLQFRETSTSDI